MTARCGTPSRLPEAAGAEGGRQLLVVDGDTGSAQLLARFLTECGRAVRIASDPETAIIELSCSTHDAVFCDLAALDERMLQALRDSPGESLAALVVLVAGGDGAAALAATRRGADDVLLRPFDTTAVALALHRADLVLRLRAENRQLRGQEPSPAAAAAPRPSGLAGMIGTGPAMQELFATIRRVAPYKTSVLITGESGTGKELVARAIHEHSDRGHRPFVAINCGAIPEALLESELFGYRRGAFTDAVRDKAGLFEEASGGTLFLDEIGELPAALQVKLLRALQESEIRRLGDNRAVIVDVRVVAATVRNLQEDASHGRFREDLFYRLNVVHLPLPSLRERMEDIEALVELFLARFSRRYRQDTQVTRVSPEAMELLRAYTWPGNVRELENTIERAVVLCDGPVIEAAMLQDKVRKALPARAALAAPTAARGELSIKKTARAIESELIRRALETTGGNRTNAAKLLEISHRALLYKIKEYGL